MELSPVIASEIQSDTAAIKPEERWGIYWTKVSPIFLRVRRISRRFIVDGRTAFRTWSSYSADHLRVDIFKAKPPNRWHLHDVVAGLRPVDVGRVSCRMITPLG